MKKWGSLLVLLILLETLSASLYLGRAGAFGFPLDDSWIHQAHARNLGLHGVLAFSPGQPSTGSTSPGWTVLLAAGYFLKIPFLFWTYFLGAVFAVATAFVAAQLTQNYFGDFRNAIIVAVICILEWHLAWAAVSGMEIGLFTFLTLLFLLLLDRSTSPYLLGGLTGVIVLVRPEGIILALMYGFKLLLNEPRQRKRLMVNGASFLLALLIVISPWILFNLTYSHRPFPNTIAAKFMVYGHPWSLWKTLRYPWNVLIYFLNGPLLILVPCAGLAIYNTLRAGSRIHFPLFGWAFSLIGIYAVALPAIYDHGRYLMPLIPLLAIHGVEGLGQLMKRFGRTSLARIAAWSSLFGMILLLWINGAADYAYRVRLFDAVHLQAARWINTHTPPDAVIATHDIGIIGYHTERPIVDLAGLVTPEIVPLMHDPGGMADFLQARHVTYLIVYSGYYRELLDMLNARLVFSPAADELRAMGVEPFEVYELSP